jgi:hypothetical protein
MSEPRENKAFPVANLAMREILLLGPCFTKRIENP